MDKDRIGGSAKEGVGKVQEGWGRATNDPDAEAKGEERQVEGKRPAWLGRGQGHGPRCHP